MSRIEKLIEDIERSLEDTTYNSIQLIKINSIHNNIPRTNHIPPNKRRRRIEMLLQTDMSSTEQTPSMPDKSLRTYEFNELNELNRKNPANGHINKFVEPTNLYELNPDDHLTKDYSYEGQTECAVKQCIHPVKKNGLCGVHNQIEIREILHIYKKEFDTGK